MHIVHRMKNLCLWPCDQTTELHLNIAQAPLKCLPGSWTHQSSTDQCRGGKGDMKRKPHWTKDAPLWGTKPTSYSDCSSVSLMRSSFNAIVHHWITSTACKTTWEAYEWELCVHCTELRAGSAAFHAIKRLSTFRSAKWINTIPVCRENNALSHPDELSRMWFLYLTLETK